MTTPMLIGKTDMKQNLDNVLYGKNNWSPKELQAIGIYAEKTLPKLRRLQTCIELQEQRARELNLQNLDNVLWKLDKLYKILSAAIALKENI